MLLVRDDLKAGKITRPVAEERMAAVRMRHDVDTATAREVAERSSIVLLCVTGSPQVEALIRGPNGLKAGLKPGSVIVDCSTADPVSTIALAQELAEAGIGYADAPLSRTPKEAWEGKLDTMVGADEATFNRIRPVLETWAGMFRYWKTFLRSTAIGCWMGITPGGATPASFMSYGMARRFAKEPETFGKGNVEGVIAPETAAHAAGTAALLPMLTLGIPGSPTAAVLLGGLLIWGLQPGPMLFVEQKEFVWGLIASMYLGNIVGLVVVLTMVPFFAAILRIPFAIVAPVILVICAIGAYTVHSSMFDVVLMLGFGPFVIR